VVHVVGDGFLDVTGDLADDDAVGFFLVVHVGEPPVPDEFPGDGQPEFFLQPEELGPVGERSQCDVADVVRQDDRAGTIPVFPAPGQQGHHHHQSRSDRYDSLVHGSLR